MEISPEIKKFVLKQALDQLQAQWYALSLEKLGVEANQGDTTAIAAKMIEIQRKYEAIKASETGGENDADGSAAASGDSAEG
ncbi:hypothetical protein ACTHPH_24055 [Paenibacillus pasadenensis]|uniref:hypothetical protein n=1 Tax=Paenibacillus pasadenensis TaxID=217090 RepID=UPI0005B9D589|nr:hypothetical protein [Paenibacillus pasadenensis]